MDKSSPMNGGDGAYSYAKNSERQRAGSSRAKGMIDEVIAEKFDVKSLMITSASPTIRVADLGCSVGPNTFSAMKDILDGIEKKCHSQGLVACEDIEYQVFFNDLVSNDFNTLFTTLPSDRRYSVAGVPGSFCDRLFPKSSIHFVHSSYSLHWITKIPRELVDKNSPAWNKGRIHYGSASDQVASAYAAQFFEDMKMFLNARANEIVVGGLMVLVMLGLPDGIHRSKVSINVVADFLGSNLIDMVNSGLINEAQVNSFNLPVYSPTVKEMTEVVELNGCFSIESMKVIDPNLEMMAKASPDSLILHARAATEGALTNHFGREVVDELFDRALTRKAEISKQLESSNKLGNQLFVVLKRK